MTKAALTLSEVEELARLCLQANGCDEANADAVAATVTAAERDGSHSHGLFRMPGYVASLRSGKVNGRADPKAEVISPAVVRVDGDGGYAPLAHERSRPFLVERAREQGLAALALVNVHHFSALWVEVEALAGEGLVAFACTAYTPSVAPAGAREAFFGTNPIAFGWPRGDGRPPMVYDQATAAMARGEVMIAARDGHALPPGVGLGPDGQPSQDPAEGCCQTKKYSYISIAQRLLETTGILRGSSEAWNHKFNLIGVSLTKPICAILQGDFHLSKPCRMAARGHRTSSSVGIVRRAQLAHTRLHEAGPPRLGRWTPTGEAT